MKDSKYTKYPFTFQHQIQTRISRSLSKNNFLKSSCKNIKIRQSDLPDFLIICRSANASLRGSIGSCAEKNGTSVEVP